jgi:beta-phosphoglucomutase family hydrolase
MTYSVDDLDWPSWDAVLFDLDGVITPTAEVHMRAWSTMFNAFLEPRGEAPYTDEDYFAHVDGKPRYDGVAAFLASRGIELPWGDPGDSPEAETVCGLGNRKNQAFAEVLAREGVEPYPGSTELVSRLLERGVRVAIVSSSANAPDVLRAAGVLEQFEAVVDGAVARDRELPGKPRPDTYVHAAELLDTAPARAVVVEDALSGVQAGAAGDFGLVVGVDRGAGRDALLDNGADVVVSDLAELVPGLLARREVRA